MNDFRERVAKLTPEQRSSLAQRQGKPATGTAEREIPRRTATGPASLSFAQQRLWFLDRLQPGSSAYNMTDVYRLTGTLDVIALERALNEIRRRHEALRTNFDSINDQPVQIIAPFEPVALPVVDLANLPEDQCKKALERAIFSQRRLPFNLQSDRLMRASLFRLGTEEHILLLVVHHCVSDGWSRRLLKQEIAALYEAFSQGKPSPLPELPIQYGDYASWQHKWLQKEALANQLPYWKKHLGGDLPVLDLPTDHARPSVQTFNGARLTMVLPKVLVGTLTSLGQRHHASLFMTMLAAFNTLLHRYSGQEDIIVGTPIAGRSRLETEKLIGLFLNTLALRTDLSGNPTFAELLQRVRDVTLDAFTYQELPFEKLVEELHPERSLSHTPVFQVLLNMFMLAEPEVSLPGLTLEEVTEPEVESKFDLTLYVRSESQSVRLDLIFNTDLFGRDRMEEMLEQFKHLLEQVAEAPDKPIRSYSLVTARSRQFLPDPTVVLPEPMFAPVTSEFLSWAVKTPTQRAVTQMGHSWTYEELSVSAQGVARTLVAHGVKPTDSVAVTGTRSFGLITGILGILMSGGVMLTISRDLPVNRQRLILNEAKVKYLLYVGDWRKEDDWLRELDSLSIIELTTQEGRPNSQGDSSKLKDIPLPEILPDAPAYVFFTSGTTGIPKGVLGCHKGLSHFLAWQRTAFEIGPRDQVAQLTNLSFEVILRDIFLPLTSGATLHLPEDGVSPGSDRMPAWLDRHGITAIHVVPTVAQSWLASSLEGVSLGKLRWTFFGGEPLTVGLVQRWRETFVESGEIVNLYGPAETTLAKCFQVVPEEPFSGVQPIGSPLPDSQALILNGSGQLCGVGEIGEIVIRTPFRTLGYVNAHEDQQKRFVKNPFRDDQNDLVYYSGDQGRYRADGTLEILGRLDDQVKIRGVRVEPDEITAILGQHPCLSACFVTARKDQQGDSILVAYVVASSSHSVTADDLRSYLGTHVPAALVPSAFVFLEKLPFTPNGKVNRRALPEPELGKPESESAFVAPRTPVERSLANIWCQVLKLKQVSVCDNFFDLGGHSLVATQIVSQIRREFNVEIPLRAIFERPTIEGLALSLLERQTSETDPAEMEQLLAEVESLSEESVETQLGDSPTKPTSTVTSFQCPSSRSAWFGKRECNLIILINERFEMESFERITRLVHDLDPTIHAVVIRDSATVDIDLPNRPTMTFSPAATRHRTPELGRVFCGYPLSKSEEYKALEKAGVPVPRWVVVTEEKTPDLSAFDEYVVRKPDYGGMSAEVLIVKKDRVKWKPITTRAAGTSHSMIVQQFIYTGAQPAAHRVNTLFGRVLYSMKHMANEDRPALSSVAELPAAVTQKGFSISASARGGSNELSFDEDVIRLAERAHAAFPDIPLLGFDIIREVPSGKLYVLEANAIGYVWNFHSRQAANYGFSFEEQFDGARKAAYILAEKTQEYAR
jgi:amino acid adenylation domain-containing protein